MLFSKYASFTGFNVETVEYKNISFTVWDVGGQDKVWSWDPSFSLILDYWKDFYAHKYHYILVPRLLLRPEVWFFWMRSPFFSLKKLPYNGLIMIFFFCFFLFYRSVPCGGTTFRTHRVLYLWWTAMTETELLRRGMNCIGCWMRYFRWELKCCYKLGWR